MGDNLVSEALEGLFADDDAAKPADIQSLFARLDRTLRREPPGHADTFVELGRWQFLGPVERRLVLLIALEGFTCEQAAQITGISCSEAKGLLGRARMKYADRFPARVGLVGAGEAVRDQVSQSLDRFGYRLVWSLGRDVPRIGDAIEPPSAIVVVGGHGDLHVPDESGLVASLCGTSAIRAGLPADFAGPVIVANGADRPDRVNNQVWVIPEADLGDGTRFRRALVRALLFSS